MEKKEKKKLAAKKLLEWINILCETYGRPKLSKQAMEVFWQVIEPYGEEVAEKAYQHVIRNCVRFPMPADWYHACETFSQKYKPGFDPRFGEVL